jgi:hypothetical protein
MTKVGIGMEAGKYFKYPRMEKTEIPEPESLP